MMNWKPYVVSGILIAGCMASGALPAQPSESVLVTEALSSSTRAILIQEMQELAAAMGRIHRAMVIGEHQLVAAEAQSVHDSFVLAQELGEDQRQEIRTRLPSAFISADQRFHELSARLMRAAGEEDVLLERVWFDEMTQACVECHQTFAGKRFVGLEAGSGPQLHAEAP